MLCARSVGHGVRGSFGVGFETVHMGLRLAYHPGGTPGVLRLLPERDGLARLRRLRSGGFGSEQAQTADRLEAEAEAGQIDRHVVPAVEVLGFPTVELDLRQAGRVSHGGEVRVPGLARERPGTLYAALAPGGDLLAILQLDPAGLMRPLRVLAAVADGS